MNTPKRKNSGDEFAVRARGNGFLYAVRRMVDEAIESRRRRQAAERTEAELARLPLYLRRDIAWPAGQTHDER